MKALNIMVCHEQEATNNNNQVPNKIKIAVKISSRKGHIYDENMINV